MHSHSYISKYIYIYETNPLCKVRKKCPCTPCCGPISRVPPSGLGRFESTSPLYKFWRPSDHHCNFKYELHNFNIFVLYHYFFKFNDGAHFDEWWSNPNWSHSEGPHGLWSSIDHGRTQCASGERCTPNNECIYIWLFEERR